MKERLTYKVLKPDKPQSYSGFTNDSRKAAGCRMMVAVQVRGSIEVYWAQDEDGLADLEVFLEKNRPYHKVVSVGLHCSIEFLQRRLTSLKQLRDLQQTQKHDTAVIHQQADLILLDILESVGLTEVVAIYKSLERWYA